MQLHQSKCHVALSISAIVCLQFIKKYYPFLVRAKPNNCIIQIPKMISIANTQYSEQSSNTGESIALLTTRHNKTYRIRLRTIVLENIFKYSFL